MPNDSDRLARWDRGDCCYCNEHMAIHTIGPSRYLLLCLHHAGHPVLQADTMDGGARYVEMDLNAELDKVTGDAERAG